MGESKCQTPPALQKVLALFVCVQAHLGYGASLGLTSVMLTQEEADEPELASPTETSDSLPVVSDMSWITGALFLGTAAGEAAMSCLPAAGPRFIFVSALLNVLGWLALGLGPGFWWMLAGRLMLGLAAGTGRGPSAGLLADLLRASWRLPADGRQLLPLLAAAEVGSACCVLAVLAVSGAAGWRVAALSCGLPPALLQLLSLQLPSSPRLLMARGKRQAAAQAVHQLRPDLQRLTSEIQQIQTSLEAPPDRRQISQYAVDTAQLLARTTLNAVSGGPTTKLFSTVIFTASGVVLSPYHCAMIVTAVGAMSTALQGCLLRQLHSRTVFLTAACLGTAACSAIGTFFYRLEELQPYGWGLIASFAVLLCSQEGASLAVTKQALKDRNPEKYRSLMMRLMECYTSVISFGQVIVYEKVIHLIGWHSVFWTMAGLNVVQVIAGVVPKQCCRAKVRNNPTDDAVKDNGDVL